MILPRASTHLNAALPCQPPFDPRLSPAPECSSSSSCDAAAAARPSSGAIDQYLGKKEEKKK